MDSRSAAAWIPWLQPSGKLHLTLLCLLACLTCVEIAGAIAALAWALEFHGCKPGVHRVLSWL